MIIFESAFYYSTAAIEQVALSFTIVTIETLDWYFVIKWGVIGG
jgi:hypothetical protein